MKKIIIFGGDGFCGWPLSLNLSKSHEILIIDNFSRRKIDEELNANSVTPIFPLEQRIQKWKELTGLEIHFQNLDISKDISQLELVFKEFKPDTIIMLAELKSAPYSIKSLGNGNETIRNNLISNHNILHLMTKFAPNSHLIHLGTMGVYGYDFSSKLIPDGYYDAVLTNHVGDKLTTKLLHPASPGSIYHLTKAQEEIMFQYFNKMYNLKITDLHQGIVWGVNTRDTEKHEVLFNRFDYDGDYGTALNRFIVQVAIDFPITVYGSGNQIRPLINIQNTVDAISLVVENPPDTSKVRILNQLSETFKIKDIAINLSNKFNKQINFQKNPRIENENNSLKAKPIGLLELGLKPIYFDIDQISDLIDLAKRFSNRINKDKIISTSNWRLANN